MELSKQFEIHDYINIHYLIFQLFIPNQIHKGIRVYIRQPR